MNKSELIEAIAKETELSKAAAGRALDVVLSTIVKTVAKKQDVQLIGFGTFKAECFNDLMRQGTVEPFVHIDQDGWLPRGKNHPRSLPDESWEWWIARLSRPQRCQASIQ